MTTAIEMHDVVRRYGELAVLDGFSLQVPSGSFTVLFGLPASGKSVVVRLVAGLEDPDEGTIDLRGAPAAGIDPGTRNIGYVPQSFALFPHYSVRRNIGYPLEIQRVDKATIAEKVERTAQTLRIEPLLDKSPDQLSGGEKQRVAIARGLVKDTDLFVLDDPLTGLDFKLREQLIEDLRDMQANLGATFLYTTSEALEALLLAENLVVMDRGRVVEAGPTSQLYHDPQRLETAHYIGFPRAAMLDGVLEVAQGAPRCTTEAFALPVELRDGVDADGAVAVAVRPEGVVIGAPSDDPATIELSARTIIAEDLGSESIVHLDVGGQELVTVIPDGGRVPALDEQVAVTVHLAAVAIYDPATGARLGQGGSSRG